MRETSQIGWGALAAWMPGWPEMPQVPPRAEVPVYLIHKGRGAGDCFFDFEEFLEPSRQGVFVWPALMVFAVRFRESFARAFGEMRAVLGLGAGCGLGGQRWGAACGVEGEGGGVGRRAAAAARDPGDSIVAVGGCGPASRIAGAGDLQGRAGGPDAVVFGDRPLPGHVMDHLEDGRSAPVWRRDV